MSNLNAPASIGYVRFMTHVSYKCILKGADMALMDVLPEIDPTLDFKDPEQMACHYASMMKSYWYAIGGLDDGEAHAQAHLKEVFEAMPDWMQPAAFRLRDPEAPCIPYDDSAGDP